MSVAAIADFRTDAGRFAPGRSGNPAGRPKGARSRTTLWAEALLEDDIEEVMRGLIAAGKAGDVRALQFIVSRFLPPARRRAVSLDIASGKELDFRHAFAATIRGLADGEITPEEGALVARVLSAAARLSKASQPVKAKVSTRSAERAPVSSQYPVAQNGAEPASVLGSASGNDTADTPPKLPSVRATPEFSLSLESRAPKDRLQAAARRSLAEKIGSGLLRDPPAPPSGLFPEGRATRAPLSHLFSTTALVPCAEAAGAPL